MKIIIFPISTTAGMAGSQRLKNLVHSLTELEVSVLNIIHISGQNNAFCKEEGRTLIQYRRSSLTSFLRTMNLICKEIKNSRSCGKNILYNYGYITLQNLPIILYAKILGFKIVIDIVEDNSTIEHSKSLLARIRVRSSLFILEIIHWFVDGIIVINEHLHSKIEKITKSKLPIFRMGITIDIKEFNTLPKDIEPNIFYGGSFGEKDGLNYLIKAFSDVAMKHQDAKLLLSGKASNADVEKLKYYIENSEARSRIVYLGYLHRDEYLGLLASSYMHCVVRINSDFANGGFPFKLGEMLASGRPVIVSKVAGVEKYLTNELDALLVNPNSSTEIYNAIIKLLGNQEFSTNIGTNGKATAEKYFSLQQYTEPLFCFFSHL